MAGGDLEGSEQRDQARDEGSLMGQLASIVGAISDEVVSRLAAKGYPPLVDGRILYGRSEQFGSSAPPRIIFTWMGSTYSTRDYYSPEQQPFGTERKAQYAAKPIAQDAVEFEVRCWGRGDGSQIDDDDMTRTLAHAVIVSVQSLAPGSRVVDGSGRVTTATFAASQQARAGSELVFGVTLLTPVLRDILPYAPSDVRSVHESSLVTPTGDSSVGCVEA